jgi:predicted dithiol-disulfide oxidoreductase (DUF899 family)
METSELTRPTLRPARALAEASRARFPNESTAYRRARTALLTEEIELRRHIERVAMQRRALPPGGEVSGDYRFEGEQGPARFEDLFGDKKTLAIYSFMYGPQSKRPCPMCTSLLSAWDGEARDVDQRISLVVVARSPVQRLLDFKKERGWRNLRLYSDLNGNFSRDYNALTPKGDDIPALNVFTRRDSTIRHFWGGEMDNNTSDPDQDPRGAPDLMPLWTILDATPEGRGLDWYPSLEYKK